MTAFRFGVSAWRSDSRAEWQEKARRAEALGFSILLVPDHLAEVFPPLVSLVSAADATTSLRVGTLVLNNDFRHPAFVARNAATIDLSPTAASSSGWEPATWAPSTTRSASSSSPVRCASSGWPSPW